MCAAYREKEAENGGRTRGLEERGEKDDKQRQ
jgi:hypothetical protein